MSTLDNDQKFYASIGAAGGWNRVPRIETAKYEIRALWHTDAYRRETFEQSYQHADRMSSFHGRPYTVWEPDGSAKGRLVYVSIAGYWTEVQRFVYDLAAGRATSNLFPTLHAWVSRWLLESSGRHEAAKTPAIVERFQRNRYLPTALVYVAAKDAQGLLRDMQRTDGRRSLEGADDSDRCHHQPLSRWLLGKDTGKDAVVYWYETPQAVALFSRLTWSERTTLSMVRTAGVEPACPEGRWNLKANQATFTEPNQSVTAEIATPATASKGKDTGKDTYAAITLSFEAIQDIIRQLRIQHSQLEKGFSDLQWAIRIHAPERFRSVATREEILKAAAYLVAEGFGREAR